MATHSGILAWRILMDRGAWQATVHGVAKSQTKLSNRATNNNLVNKLFLWVLWATPTNKQNPRGGLLEALIYSQLFRSSSDNLDLPLASAAWGGAAILQNWALNLWMWCLLQENSVKTELDHRTASWCQRTAWRPGNANPSMNQNWWPEPLYAFFPPLIFVYRPLLLCSSHSENLLHSFQIIHLQRPSFNNALKWQTKESQGEMGGRGREGVQEKENSKKTI